MQADLFYQTTTENAIPLVFLNHAQRLEDANPCMTVQQFQGGLGEICLIGDNVINKVYIGLGHGDEALALAHVVNRLPEGLYFTEKPLSHRAMLSWSLAQYKFDRYKKHTALPRVLAIHPSDFPFVQAESEAVFLVRDLINTPTNDMGPAEMADVLEGLAQAHEATFEQWIGDELLRHNCPAIHAVGRAAATPPRLLSLTWGDESHPKVTLVGKGVCFDSGGLDLKSSPNMRLMKKDMGGAAQVIGLAKIIMMLALPIRLQVLIPAVENAIGSNAYRPGDILTMRNGLTVEIDNTDAEGRLVVADALVMACEENPELIIDFTTLTGAARVAVGTEISAMFTNSDPVAQKLASSSDKTHDPIWRMPLFAGYASQLDSNIADLVNSPSSSYAGAITAALFLQHFVLKTVDWVHFDIMAWNTSSKPGKPEGGEAMGLRAVAHYLMERFQHKIDQ
jgi:leucyl aminopeptidase